MGLFAAKLLDKSRDAACEALSDAWFVRCEPLGRETWDVAAEAFGFGAEPWSEEIFIRGPVEPLADFSLQERFEPGIVLCGDCGIFEEGADLQDWSEILLVQSTLKCG